MPHLLIIAFDAHEAAAAVLTDLRELEHEEGLKLDDACIVERDARGRLQIEQGVGAFHPHEGQRGAWRSLLARLTREGAEPAAVPTDERQRVLHDALHEVIKSLANDSSALLVMLEADPHEALAEALGGHQGRLVRCDLSLETCARLRAALAGHPDIPPAELLGLFASRERQRRALEKASARAQAEREAQHERMLLSEERFDARESEELMRRCTIAARKGQVRVLAMRFPLDLCSDRGRAINMAEPEWPRDLSGKPKALHGFWRSQLAPLGYRIEAGITAYEDDRPSEAGIFITW